MIRRRAALVLTALAGVLVVPFATAAAQAPDTTAPAAAPAVTEGSVPPGGTVTCSEQATLDPPDGPPGTEVTVTAQLSGNCDDIIPSFWLAFTCTGEYLVPGQEAVPFPMTVGTTNELDYTAVGSFVAPILEPNPPVVDATVPISVTVTCVEGLPSSGAVPQGPQGGTTYVLPAGLFTLELFAEPDGDQPTLVEDDEDEADDGGVVSATPPFTG